MFSRILELIRVRQYVKNLFVFCGILFAVNPSISLLFDVLLVFISFCLASSCVYVFNDLRDLESDKNHPKKKHRPLAGGYLSKKTAIYVIFVLLVFLVLLMGFLSSVATTIICIYLFQNVYNNQPYYNNKILLLYK